MRAAFDVGASRPVAPGPFRSSARLASRIKTTNAHRACRSGWDVADLVPRVSRGARPLNAVGRNAEGRASDAGHPRARLAAVLAAATLAWSAPALAEEALAAASPEGPPHGNATEMRASGTGANATEPGLASFSPAPAGDGVPADSSRAPARRGETVLDYGRVFAKTPDALAKLRGESPGCRSSNASSHSSRSSPGDFCSAPRREA